MNKTIRAGLLLLVLMIGASACTSLLGGFDFVEATATSGGMTTTGTGGTGGAMTTGSGGTDVSPPTVTFTNPTKGASNVPASAEVHATFSEVLDPSTVTGSTFTVTNGGVPVSGTVTSAGTTATFTPTSDLALDGSFLATVSTGVTDLAGNALATEFTWTFATSVEPTVIATSPVDGSQNVALNSLVTATFSVKMAPASITAATFVVRHGAVFVSGTVSYSGTTATFAPTGNYVPNAPVTATITTGAKDLLGNGLGQDHVWGFQTGTKVAQAPIALGMASPFGVLASDMINNANSVGTIVNGDLGVSPGNSVMNFPPGVINGGKYLGLAAAGAQQALLAAYNDASTRPGGAVLVPDIAGVTFFPGLYTQASAVTLSTGTCTLDAQGDSNAIFIFQIGTSFGLAANSMIVLSGGAKATNVYWTTGGAVTLGAASKLEGTVLANTSITLGIGAKVEGRLLARGTLVDLNTNVITVPAP